MHRKLFATIFAGIPALVTGALLLGSTVYGAEPDDAGKGGTSSVGEPAAPQALDYQGKSSSAYNSINSEFLVVWEDSRNNNWDIYAQRVDADGTMLGNNFAIAVTAEFEQEVAVAYNSNAGANEYLVVYRSDSKIFGQRVSAAGTLTGQAFDITSGSTSAGDPAIAYSSGDNQYLVVWKEYLQGQNFNIRGRRVAGNGTPQGSVIDIATAAESEANPAVSYSTSTKEFLVVYEVSAFSGYSVKARRVTGTGTVQPPTLSVSDINVRAHTPDVTYNTASNVWLVAWSDQRNEDMDIYAQLVNTAGMLVSTNYPVTTDDDMQQDVRIAYSSSASKYLAVWASFGPQNFEIRAQALAGNSALSGEDVLVSTGSDREYNPSLAAGAGTTSFLTVFNDDRQGDSDLFAQRFDSNVALAGVNFPVAPIPYLINTPTPVVTPSATPTPCVVSYSDVPVGSTFYEFIRCLSCRNVLSGYADGTFKPGNNVTRAQLAKIVSNAAGFSETPDAQLFQDVAPGNTFYDVIYRLAHNGAISGYACGSAPGEPCVGPDNRPYFRPGNNATRGQIAKIIWEAADFGVRFAPSGGQTFQDVPPANTFYAYIEDLTQQGVMGGYACGSVPSEPCVAPDNRPYFRPGNNATRGQVAKMVYNTFFPNCQGPGPAPGPGPAVK